MRFGMVRTRRRHSREGGHALMEVILQIYLEIILLPHIVIAQLRA